MRYQKPVITVAGKSDLVIMSNSGGSKLNPIVLDASHTLSGGAYEVDE